MKLRIVAGTTLADRYEDEAGLQVLLRLPGVVIQGDATVEVIASGGQPTAILAGRAIGWQTASGEMRRIEDVNADLEPLLRQQPIDRCLDALEGRYILVQINPDGSCDISCDRFGQADLYYQYIDDGIVLATDLSLLPLSIPPNAMTVPTTNTPTVAKRRSSRSGQYCQESGESSEPKTTLA